MKIQRFFIEQELIPGKEIRIDDRELVHQLKDVFRLGAGDQVILLDGSGFAFLSDITMLSKNEAVIAVGEKEQIINVPKREIWLFCSLPKKDKFEWIAEKGTELGVSHFVPVISERSEKKNLNDERVRKIIKEAAEQSERGILPELHSVMELEAAIGYAKEKCGEVLALHPQGKPFDLEAEKDSLAVFIGPEGGFSEKETELFRASNIPVFTLGTQVLKAETAALAAATLLLL